MKKKNLDMMQCKSKKCFRNLILIGDKMPARNML